MVDWDAMLANVKLDDTDTAPEATCDDCIHHNVCGYHITDETDLTVEECTHFKNKADSEEVKHGRWIEWYPPKNMILTGEELLHRCSSCDAKYSDVEGYNYCPNCGAKMDGDTE